VTRKRKLEVDDDRSTVKFEAKIQCIDDSWTRV